MQLTLDVPHVFNPDSSEDENAYVLRGLLECLIYINRGFLRSHPNVPSLYNSGVRYRRTMVWDSIPALYGRRYGDCKSLTAARIAELREKGITANPVFRFKRNDRGELLYHILVQTGSGFEDPSKKLGMGANENAPYQG
jgi:hypothetical protein